VANEKSIKNTDSIFKKNNTDIFFFSKVNPNLLDRDSLEEL